MALECNGLHYSILAMKSVFRRVCTMSRVKKNDHCQILLTIVAMLLKH